jgi:hypothetical protein
MEPALYFEKGDSRRTFSYPLYSCYVQHSDNNTLIRKRFVSHLDKMVDYLCSCHENDKNTVHLRLTTNKTNLSEN